MSPSKARPSLGPFVALGASLARRGPLAVIALAVAVATTLSLIGLAIAFARRGGDAPVHGVPMLASSALAWGAGIFAAFAAAVRALRRDRSDGVRHLFVARTASLRGYLLARIGGLALHLVVIVGGGTLLVGLAAILATTRPGTLDRTVQATVASLVYAIAFAAVLAPVALAALGARQRVGGYLVFLALLVIPELVVSALSGSLPNEVVELISLPSVLAALRASLAPDTTDVLRFMRALVALGIMIGVAAVLVRRDVILLERGGEE